MTFLYLKALHIIFVVTWFAGLFYIVRLFIYHVEAENRPENEKKILQDQYKIMESRLWYGITWPSMILTYILGFWLIYEMYGWELPAWLVLKLSFVFGLTLYHIRCGIIFYQLQHNIVKMSSIALRIWNEVATVFLFAIVFIVVVGKVSLDKWWYGLAALLLFSGLLLLAIKIYRKKREK